MNAAMAKARRKMESASQTGLCVLCLKGGLFKVLSDFDSANGSADFHCPWHGALRDGEWQFVSRKRVRRASRRGARKASKMRPR